MPRSKSKAVKKSRRQNSRVKRTNSNRIGKSRKNRGKLSYKRKYGGSYETNMDIVVGWKNFFAGRNEKFLEDDTRFKLNVLAETIVFSAYFDDSELDVIKLDKLNTLGPEFSNVVQDIRTNYSNRLSQSNLQ